MENEKRRPTLLRLSDTDLIVLDPEEDIRGFAVMDQNSDEIGEVSELIIDDQEKKVRFIEVAEGGFVGIGERRFLIPVDAVTKIEDGMVQVDRTHEHIQGAPQYDPELSDEDFWEETYKYYGFTPYWGPGYIYPGMPFMR